MSFSSLLLCTLLLLSHVLLFTAPRTAARWASLSFTISRSLLRLICSCSDSSALARTHLLLLGLICSCSDSSALESVMSLYFTMSFFPLTAFKIFSLYLVLSNVTMICIRVCVFVFFCIYPDLSLNSDLFIFASNLSQLFSSGIFFHLPFFFSFWNCT